MVVLQPRVAGDMCVRCRKQFSPGDRITPVMIVMKRGRHPDNPKEVGVHMSSEFELAHIDCHDRALTVPVVVAGVSL